MKNLRFIIVVGIGIRIALARCFGLFSDGSIPNVFSGGFFWSSDQSARYV
jgi:hypothetical protein